MKKLLISTLALFSVLAVSAQNDLSEVYEKAVEAFNAKDYATAVTGFERLIDEGIDSDDADVQDWVYTAKASLPRCYFMLGGAAFQQGNFDEALADFTKSADLGELYGNAQQATQSRTWVANIYKVQGEKAFNSEDYATAIEIYSKAYAADPRNTDLALRLAASYAESAVAGMEAELYGKGMEIYRSVAALDNPKFAEAAASAKEQAGIYTNNMIAKMQIARNNAGLIALTDGMIAADAQDAFAHKVRIQTLFAMEDYQGVIAAVPAAVDAQTNDVDRSEIFYILGATFNARSQAPQAIDAFKKVTAGQHVAAAKQAVDQLSKTI